MSRTDKTDPQWVTAVWWEPLHHRCHHDRILPAGRPCDLPERPVRRRPVRHRITRETPCVWVPCWPRTAWDRSAPRWFTDHVWTSPRRALVRDQCREALARYRADGDVDIVIDTSQHRHGAGWQYW